MCIRTIFGGGISFYLFCGVGSGVGRICLRELLRELFFRIILKKMRTETVLF